MPESAQQREELKQIPTYTKHYIKFEDVSFTYPNGHTELDRINLEVPDGKSVAVSGGIGSGKNVLAQLLLKHREPSFGKIIYNDIDISQLNTAFWRREIMSFCGGSPKFISGTIRDNFKLLSPDITDEKIFAVFKEIGAMDFVKKFDNFLEFQISELGQINDSTKNLLNLVRAVLKPASLYVFNQCFEHVKHEYTVGIIEKLRRENKTAVFISYDGTICRNCDTVYVLKSGQICGHGTHASLIKSNKDYRSLNGAGSGVLIYEEKMTENQESVENFDAVNVSWENAEAKL
jgi:ABC-type multidrug transport system fused ATPase/permease subunit